MNHCDVGPKSDCPWRLGNDYYGGSFRFSDWDGDGRVDLLIGYYHRPGGWNEGGQATFMIYLKQQLPNGTFQIHELVTVNITSHHWSFPYKRYDEPAFQVVDWDGDQQMDLLVCHWDKEKLEVVFINGSFLGANRSGKIDADVIFSYDPGRPGPLKGNLCNMLPVDFDADGDVDLFLGGGSIELYLERTSAGLIQRESDTITDAIRGHIEHIADVDGDGQLEVIASDFLQWRSPSAWISPLRLFRRALDGNFVEAVDNPLAGMMFGKPGLASLQLPDWNSIHFADWNSDGLVDVLNVRYQEGTFVVDYYQHVLKLDLAYNRHFTAYETIRTDDWEFRIVDWNQDGWDDVLVSRHRAWLEDGESGELRLFQVTAREAKKLDWGEDPFKDIRPIRSGGSSPHFSLIDFDGDGDLELIMALDSVRFFEMDDSGHLKADEQHPFSKISIDQRFRPRVLPVDWDNDGDFDLLLGAEGTKEAGGLGRYFEQLADGTFKEWPEQDMPFGFLCSSMSWWNRQCNFDVRFLDCDGDGDVDLIRRTGQQFQACEHTADTVRCDDNFLCLGTNLSHFSASIGPFQEFGPHWDVGNSSDGRLKLFTTHPSSFGIVHWTAGFCDFSRGSKDPCNSRGACRPGHFSCQCFRGYELQDCSKCEPNYFTNRRRQDTKHSRDCKPCPGEGGEVCYGRGVCFDDASAQEKAAQEEDFYMAAVRAIGNGSCHCNEAGVFGQERIGRMVLHYNRVIKFMVPSGTAS